MSTVIRAARKSFTNGRLKLIISMAAQLAAKQQPHLHTRETLPDKQHAIIKATFKNSRVFLATYVCFIFILHLHLYEHYYCILLCVTILLTETKYPSKHTHTLKLKWFLGVE